MASSAIAPITGRFRKRIVFDLFGSLALGLACGSVWWFGHHVPKMAQYRAHDARVKLEIDAENAAFLAAQAQVSSE
jgi:cytochrome c oxidase subunit 7